MSEEPAGSSSGVDVHVAGDVGIIGDHGTVNWGVVSTGDQAQITAFFGGGFERLADAYLSPGALRRELDPVFVGRDSLIGSIDEFLGARDRGWVVVEGPAGVGKTALLAHLAFGRGWAHHFVRRNDETTRQQDRVLRSLAAQIIPACGLGTDFAPGGILPDAAGRADWFDRLLEAASQRRPTPVDPTTPTDDQHGSGGPPEVRAPPRLVVVVDGLEEAAGAAPLLGLPSMLPAGVYVVAARRIGDAALPVTGPRLLLTLDQNSQANRDDIRARLERLALEPAILQQLRQADRSPDWLVGRLLDACQGIWIYLRYVTAELRDGYRTVDNLDSLPADLGRYYAEVLASDRDAHPDRWDRQTLRLLAAMAAAGEPLPARRLMVLAGLDVDPQLRRRLDGAWRPFLQITSEDGQEPRYAPYHASMVEFLRGHRPEGTPAGEDSLARELRTAVTDAHRSIADLYLTLWGGLGNSLPGLADPVLCEADDGYGRRHLSGHLVAARRVDDLHHLLDLEYVDGGRTVNAWFHAHDRSGDPTGFLNDLDVATLHAQRDNDQLLSADRPAPGVALEFRYALIRDALISRVSNLPDDLLIQIVDAGIWPVTRALALARRLPDPAVRIRALTGLAPHLPAALLAEAVSAARGITDESARAWVLAGLAPHLPAALLAEAVSAARGITDESARAQVLAGLAPHLPAALLAEAVSAARGITDESARAQVLAGLAPHLPAALLAEAVTAACDITSDIYRAQALTGLAPHLPEPERGTTLAEAVSAARGIPDEYSRAEALTRLAPHLPEPERGTALVEALSAARDITDEYARVQVLAGLAPHLPEPERGTTLAEAVSAARDITGESIRAWVLAELAPHLPAPLLAEAVTAARGIADESTRARVLAELAPHLPAPLLAEALAPPATSPTSATASRRWPDLRRTCRIPNAAPSSPRLSAAARAITDEYYRARGVDRAGSAPAGGPARRGPRRRPRHHQRVCPRQALTGLAPHLPEPSGTALAEALSAARASQ